MASCQTSRWVSTAPYVKLTVVVDSNTDTTATLKYTLQYIADSAANCSGARPYTIKIGSETITGSYDIDGVTGTKTIITDTVSISKGTSSKSVAFSVSFQFNLTWSGIYGGTKSDSSSITVGAKTSYTVTYNANGGSGAPSKQTKWHGSTLTLSSTKPTRTGHSFQGWGTSASDTSVNYAAGASYTSNASVTLYAIWKANTYTVTYNANGGSGAPSAQTKTYGKTLTLSGTKPTRANYTFKGWGTSKTATTVTYNPSGSYTSNANITLYAIWELSYTKPEISNFSVSRCDSGGNITEQGTYALVKFNWTISKSTATATIECTAANFTPITKTITLSGTSGNVSEKIGDGKLSTGSTFTFVVTITDEGGSWNASRILGGMVFPIGVRPAGKGVSFGKTAELDGYADVGFKMLHRDHSYFENNKVICGTKPDGRRWEAFNPQNENGNTVLGYDNYDNKEGLTNIYGYDVNIGTSNIASPGYYRPYRRQGDSLTLTFRGAGYVTNSGTDVSFWIPVSCPIIGSPTVTIATGNGFSLRQGEHYTHGSTASSYTAPTKYEATVYMFHGVYIKAVFSDTTNVINNSPIGILWNGTITFS